MCLTLNHSFSIIPDNNDDWAAGKQLRSCASEEALQMKPRRLPGFIGVGHPHWVVGDVDHGGVFNFVDRVPANIGHLSTLGDQHDVVALQKTHKPCQEMPFFIILFKQASKLRECWCKKQLFGIKQNKPISLFYLWQICRSTIQPKSMTIGAKWLTPIIAEVYREYVYVSGGTLLLPSWPKGTWHVCTITNLTQKSMMQHWIFFQAANELVTRIQRTIGGMMPVWMPLSVVPPPPRKLICWQTIMSQLKFCNVINAAVTGAFQNGRSFDCNEFLTRGKDNETNSICTMRGRLKACHAK